MTASGIVRGVRVLSKEARPDILDTGAMGAWTEIVTCQMVNTGRT